MAKLTQDGRGVVVEGAGGRFKFDRDYSPGEGPSDFFGAGAMYEYQFRLYDAPGRLVVVATRVESAYGESQSDTVYVSADGGRTFVVQPAESPPTTPPTQVLVVR